MKNILGVGNNGIRIGIRDVKYGLISGIVKI